MIYRVIHMIYFTVFLKIIQPPFITLARVKYKIAFRSAQENIALAITRINDVSYETKIREYLCLSLNTRSERIITQAMLRLKGQLWRARDFLNESERIDYNNIIIVSTRRIVDAVNPFNSQSIIQDLNHLRKIPLAFTFWKILIVEYLSCLTLM